MHANAVSLLPGLLLFMMSLLPSYTSATEFDTGMLDAEDTRNVDFSRFSSEGYVMPGRYSLTVLLNDHRLGEKELDVFPTEVGNAGSPAACLSADTVDMLGLRKSERAKLVGWHQGQCFGLQALPGSAVRINLSQAELAITLPQAYLDERNPDWDPPSRWDNGIPGAFIDYDLSTTVLSPEHQGSEMQGSVFGTAGANAGAWRLRGDYQGDISRATGRGAKRDFRWSRFYAYRPLPSMRARATLGESILDTEIFDTWRYTGAGLSSDEAMLAPDQRGYAPEVSGIAHTNARVVISQQGQVIYQTTVPAGPFRIQTLSSTLSGKLNVRVEEQNGEVQHFEVDASAVPYLTRPGHLRYKIAAGRPSRPDHQLRGPLFTVAEFSWGISSAWTLYGGTTFSAIYQAVAAGIGRDLFGFGAVSADVTQSLARLRSGARESGKSWRLNYSKYFSSLNGGITFAGYRFSERNFLSMDQFLNLREHPGLLQGRSKSMYNIMMNKSFSDSGISLYLNYSHQNYWDRPATRSYTLTLSRLFDMFSLKHLSLSLSATRTQLAGRHDDMLFVSLSLPLDQGSVSYDVQRQGRTLLQSASYYRMLDRHNAWRLSAGGGNRASSPAYVNGYLNHKADWSDMSLTAAYSRNQYRSAGLTLQGGITATPRGLALSAGNGNGGTRMMVDTSPAGGIPVNGGEVVTNPWGKGVLTNQSSYYRLHTSIDVNHLPSGVEIFRPVNDTTLTEGAIGYHRFDVLKGWKGMIAIKRAGKLPPPFGASVQDEGGRERGIVGDGGQVYVAGLREKESLRVVWDGKPRCRLRVPADIATAPDTLALRCKE
ncbi:fimbria/pilus outer membrane usher protein [Pantoea sp. B623]|uniref:fimbria/pilus outer membrane usher protein n=1 Tax=Pantoea sp. B623 TaxID=2974561 RepID=UPI00286E7955|nr:fimbria/pilus outer membrane usher protein [Pantoea sp. B623]